VLTDDMTLSFGVARGVREGCPRHVAVSCAAGM